MAKTIFDNFILFLVCYVEWNNYQHLYCVSKTYFEAGVKGNVEAHL